MKEIAIIHFQPIEKYPPVMNILNTIGEMENISCIVFSTHHKNNNWFSVHKVSIKRVS